MNKIILVSAFGFLFSSFQTAHAKAPAYFHLATCTSPEGSSIPVMIDFFVRLGSDGSTLSRSGIAVSNAGGVVKSISEIELAPVSAETPAEGTDPNYMFAGDLKIGMYAPYQTDFLLSSFVLPKSKESQVKIVDSNANTADFNCRR